MAGDLISTEVALSRYERAKELSPLGQSLEARIALAAASDTVCIVVDSKLSRNNNKAPLWIFRAVVTAGKGWIIYNNLKGR